MARRRGPALYELVRVRQRGGPFAEGQPSYASNADDEETEDRQGRWWTGGRTIRLPVGYIFVAIGLGVALLFGGYFLGYTVRDRQIRADRSETARDDLAGITDPTLEGVPESPGLIEDLGEPGDGGGGGRASAVGEAGPRENPLIIDDWMADPRESGMNYFIVATQPPEEGNRIASFLADRGLEVARLPVDNRGLAIVVVLEPFAPGEVGSARARQLEARIKRLGREYKRDNGGGTDFESAYMKKYR